MVVGVLTASSRLHAHESRVVGATQIAAGWPTWLALNSGRGATVTFMGALVSLGLALSVIYLLGKLSSRAASAA